MTDFGKQISRDASELGVRKGSVLLVHSSLRSLGTPGVTPEDVIEGYKSGGYVAIIGEK